MIVTGLQLERQVERACALAGDLRARYAAGQRGAAAGALQPPRRKKVRAGGLRA